MFEIELNFGSRWPIRADLAHVLVKRPRDLDRRRRTPPPSFRQPVCAIECLRLSPASAKVVTH